jgi:hypothetical protein
MAGVFQTTPAFYFVRGIKMRIPTMLIDVKGAPCVINESDFNPSVHKRWKEAKKAAVKPKAKAVATHKGGGRWVVTVNKKQIHEGTLTKAKAMALVAEH